MIAVQSLEGITSCKSNFKAVNKVYFTSNSSLVIFQSRQTNPPTNNNLDIYTTHKLILKKCLIFQVLIFMLVTPNSLIDIFESKLYNRQFLLIFCPKIT